MKAPQPMADVRRNLKALRTARRWSRDEMAKRLTAAGHSITGVQVGFIETGRRKAVSVDEFYAFAHVLGVPLDRLAEPGPRCDACLDSPPQGFACLACHTETPAEARS